MTQGKLLGGTSGINSMNMVRGNPSDYDSWENVYNASGWSYRSILQYFKETEKFTINDERITKVSEYHGDAGETPVNYPNYYTNLSNVFLEACKESGYEYVDYNGQKKSGYSRTQTNTFNGTRMSAFTCFLHMQSYLYQNLRISINSTATKIYFNEENRATTVEFMKDGKKMNVTAGREVVVAAGAIGSAKLLMLSGIGPKEQLEKYQIPVVAELPVGDGLQDHVIFLGLLVTTTNDLIGFKDLFDNTSIRQYQEHNRTGLLTLPGAYEAFLFTDSLTNSTSPEAPDIALALTALFPSPQIAQSPYVSNQTYEEFYKPLIVRNKTGFMTTITMVQPQSRGTVMLNSANPDDPPLIDPKLLSVEDDVTRTVQGILKVKEVFEKTKAMQRIGAKVYDTPLPYCKDHPMWSVEYLKCFLKYAGFPGMHVCCTCAMGNHNRSVVDERLRVKKVTSLRVIDASVMPAITSGNTHAPVMMIAAKGAAMIIEDAIAADEAVQKSIKST
ncbi:glucose dehydrogenase [FAD, quinone]-like [Haemaphysalis longicornis]